MTSLLHRVFLTLQLLGAELCLLYGAPKKDSFGLRLLAAVVICLAGVMIIPSSQQTLYDNNVLVQFGALLAGFIWTFICMMIAFDLNWKILFSYCVAGYAVQHIAYHFANLLGDLGFMRYIMVPPLDHQLSAEALVFPFVYLAVILLLGRRLGRDQMYERFDWRISAISVIIVFICIGLTRVAVIFGDAGSVSVSLYAITCCTLALVIQFFFLKLIDLKMENETVSILLQESEKQYALSKKTIDTINIKYHDLKHKLKSMSLQDDEVKEIKDAVRIYGSQIKTGNEPLDVLLTENSLRCSENGIRLTFTGNGEDLKFMKTMDVYALFGNAIDNAVEAVQQLSEQEKRVIDILCQKNGDMIVINVTNYFDGKLDLEDGLPRTSKQQEPGFHGFGIKSIKAIAEKYGGSVKIAAEDDLFNLSVYLMAK